MKSFVKILALVLLFATLLCAPACGGTDGTETGDGSKIDPPDILPGYDYASADMTKLLSFGDWNYKNMTVSITEVPAVSDEDVKNEFNSYFNAENNVFYQAIADQTKPVAEGDTVYLLYCGITRAVLEKAGQEGKISDVRCTGLTYSEIVALGLGFSGGTSSGVTALKIGSGSFIPGFESGLVGYVPAEAGEENPVPVELTFPASYGSAELAGQAATFFCKLVYIGDAAAGAYTADTITVEYVNKILNLSGDRAYESLDACFAKVREGLEKERETSLYNAKSNAIFKELSTRAIMNTVPDEMLTAYVNSVISTYLADMVDLYNNYPSYYANMFGTTKPSEALVAAYLGYQGTDYMTQMKADAAPAVKNEMIFWYFVQTEGIALTDAEREAKREEYIALYGESVFDGIDEKTIEEQFLRDKFVSDLIKELDEKGSITYTPAA